jgi:hypothetical protein
VTDEQSPAANGAPHTNTVDSPNPSSGVELLRQLQRRVGAAKRIPGGDPLTPAERALGRSREHPRPDRPPLTPKQLDAAVDAVDHLLAHDLLPLLDAEICRALWRAGHRELAAELARVAGAA